MFLPHGRRCHPTGGARGRAASGAILLGLMQNILDLASEGPGGHHRDPATPGYSEVLDLALALLAGRLDPVGVDALLAGNAARIYRLGGASAGSPPPESGRARPGPARSARTASRAAR